MYVKWIQWCWCLDISRDLTQNPLISTESLLFFLIACGSDPTCLFTGSSQNAFWVSSTLSRLIHTKETKNFNFKLGRKMGNPNIGWKNGR